MKAVFGLVFAAVLVRGFDSDRATELLSHATQLYRLARYGEAEPLYRQGLEALSRGGPQVARQRATAMLELGALLRTLGRYAEAEPLLRDSGSALESCGAGAREVVRALDNLAALDRARGDLAGAESLALRAVGMMAGETDVPEPERQAPRVILASVYLDQQRMAEAETAFRAVLEGADGPLAVAAYNGLAIVAISRESFAEAEGYARQALYYARLALPPNHPATAAAWNNLAQTLRFQGRYLEAEKDYREALAIFEDALGPSSPEFAKGLSNLAAFYHERGREAGAEDLYMRAAAIFERALGKSHTMTLVTRNELAEVLRAERRYTESEKLERTTLAPLLHALGPNDPRVTHAATNYARLLCETRRPADAEQVLNRFR